MAAASEQATGTKSFTPKNPPKLNPPKDDPISIEELSKCNGTTIPDPDPNPNDPTQ